MVYAYRCEPCRHQFDVYKRASAMTDPEMCPKCGVEAKREFVPRNVYLSKTKVQHAEYNPGLGCIVKNERHRKELCKQKGLVEVGNDFKSGDGMHAHHDKARSDAWERGWDAVDSAQWVGNGQPAIEVKTDASAKAKE